MLRKIGKILLKVQNIPYICAAIDVKVVLWAFVNNEYKILVAIEVFLDEHFVTTLS